MTRDEALAALGSTVQPDETLKTDGFGGYVLWRHGWDYTTLDGAFTADYLEAVAWWMRQDRTDRHQAAVEQSFRNNRGDTK